MKVTSPNHPATAAAASISHRKTAAPASGEQFTVTAVTADADQTPETPPVAAKNAAAHAGKAVPPGLAKVQARLQELAASNPNSGRSNALSVINRNVARYAEQQAAVTTPETSATPETPPATPPLASTPSESPTTPEDSTTTTSETVAAATVAPDTASGTAA